MRIRLHKDVEVAEVSVGDGRRGNALGAADWRELERIFRDLSRWTELRTVVVRGEGGTFSSGSDMREWAGAEPAGIEESFAAMEAAFTAVEELPVPVIAQVEGVAAGAGCQLALACDLRIMAESARIGMPIARLGILVSPPFAARLTLAAGPAVARDLLYTGRLVSAAEAVRLGLATRRVPDQELASATRALVLAITRHPGSAVRAAKSAVDAVVEPARAAARAVRGGPPVSYEDLQRGITTFLAREPPESSGEDAPRPAR